MSGPRKVLLGRWVFGLIIASMGAVVALTIRADSYVPCVALGLLGLTGAFVLQRLLDARRARMRPGACRRCGYDRTGIGRDAPCPECGERTA